MSFLTEQFKRTSDWSSRGELRKIMSSSLVNEFGHSDQFTIKLNRRIKSKENGCDWHKSNAFSVYAREMILIDSMMADITE